MNKNQKGCFAEYHFATTAMLNGFNISFPLLDSTKYDCIIEKAGKLFKIQVKYLGKYRYKHGNSVQITLRRTGATSYDINDVDYDMIPVLAEDVVRYVWPYELKETSES